ncbi:LOW QUALITY PROTEIN: uncharacterized protein LOC115013823, partial [Cottoperca gobio]|uniref:LOW QUALITY PROTEIN: uncharacterized protein LOC115013823 n=1 Tax=Cottoperca gobio TaxID=56716 RepID=A0A6J2QEW8_COTGO
KTSVQPTPTDAPTILSSHTATPPSRPAGTKTSVQPNPTTVTTPALKTGTSATYVTSPPPPPSVTEISVRPKPSELSRTISTPTETCVSPRPPSDTSIVCALVVVIVFLSLLLFAACFLAVLHRKRNNKTVTPGRPEENRKESKEVSRSSRAQSPRHSEKRENDESDSETGWRRSFTGVRAKSANAVLFMSPFCAPVKDQVTLQTETDAGHRAEGKQKLGDEAEADGGIETETLTNAADVINNAKQADAGRSLDNNPHCVSANTDTVPYLSIGTIQSKPSPGDFNKQSTDACQRSQKGKVMARISTWPPTAVQWQARCKMREGEGLSEVFTEWTQRFPGEVKRALKKDEHPSASDRDENEDEIEKNQLEDPLKMTVADLTFGLSQCSEPK